MDASVFNRNKFTGSRDGVRTMTMILLYVALRMRAATPIGRMLGRSGEGCKARTTSSAKHFALIRHLAHVCDVQRLCHRLLFYVS
jgi:hypothetical protein